MFQLRQYLHHRWHAKTKHGVHSPFVYDFTTQVLPHRPTDAGARIDALRTRCGRSDAVIAIEDFGAGYGGAAQPLIHKSLREIVRSSARGRREGELLLRLCQHYAPAQVLELGTNLGFSTLYILAGLAADAQLITIEGSKDLSKVATQHFSQWGYQPQQCVGEFDTVLQQQIDWATFHPNFVLLDGNHREAATMRYFEYLLPRVAPGAMLVVDDIYWSAEMASAWRQICQHPRVTVSIDLFAMGICFLDRPQAQEHFRLRFKAW
jgi:predicted O-methyltransferase YrrM